MATTRQTDKHTGSYRDTPLGALLAATNDVNVFPADYISLTYSDDMTLVPLDPEKDHEIDVELFYSTTREQWKATLRRVPRTHY